MREREERMREREERQRMGFTRENTREKIGSGIKQRKDPDGCSRNEMEKRKENSQTDAVVTTWKNENFWEGGRERARKGEGGKVIGGIERRKEYTGCCKKNMGKRKNKKLSRQKTDYFNSNN